MMNDRQQKLYEWIRGPRGKLIGEGNYGKVYLSGIDGAVVKELSAKKSSCAAGLKLAYREHVMSLFQNALVLKRIAPHFCLHYGYEATPTNARVAFSLFLEGFDGNLQTEGTELLGSASATPWASLCFQIGTGLVALAVFLDVCHNDLYPRNILVRRDAARVCRYEVLDATYDVPLPFLAVITDFGVCSSPMLSSPAAGPEVKRTKITDPPKDFGETPHVGHILNFNLPPFSRDFYMMFKWLAFPPKFFPPVPHAVRKWSIAVLRLIDKDREKFATPGGSKWIFATAFRIADPRFLQAATEPTETFRLRLADRSAFIAEVTAHLRAFPYAED
jgi:serine/threonine protein kinase